MPSFRDFYDALCNLGYRGVPGEPKTSHCMYVCVCVRMRVYVNVSVCACVFKVCVFMEVR